MPLTTEIKGCYRYLKPCMLAEKCLLSIHQYLVPGKKISQCQGIAVRDICAGGEVDAPQPAAEDGQL